MRRRWSFARGERGERGDGLQAVVQHAPLAETACGEARARKMGVMAEKNAAPKMFMSLPMTQNTSNIALSDRHAHATPNVK